MTQDFILRAPKHQEAEEISALLLRSKAYWGYSADFMAACVDVLRVTPATMDQTRMVVAVDPSDRIVGASSVIIAGEVAELDLLYVDPSVIGKGAGALLFRDAAASARTAGASSLTIIADPQAEAFYRHMGAVKIGEAPSEAIPGRNLPLLELKL